MLSLVCLIHLVYIVIVNIICSFFAGFYLFISQGHKERIHKFSSVPLVMVVLCQGRKSNKLLEKKKKKTQTPYSLEYCVL